MPEDAGCSLWLHIARVLVAPRAVGSLLPVRQHIRPCSKLAAQQQATLAVAPQSPNPQRCHHMLQQHDRGLPRSRGSSLSGATRPHTSGAAALADQQQHSPFRGDAASRTSHSSMGQTDHSLDQPQAAPLNQQQPRRQQQTASRSNSIDTGAAEARSVLLHKQQQSRIAASQLAPGGSGPSSHATYTPQSTARDHLHQYLASIETMGFAEDLAAGIWAGNRLAISRSLTLCESSRPDHALQAAALLRLLIDHQQQRKQAQHATYEQPQQQDSASSITQGTSSSQQQQQPQELCLTSEQQAAGAGVGATIHQQLSSQAGSVRTSLRVGVSGPPGVGKSSFIETWGCYLADHGSKVAVLAVDPSSVETGGAILGDKTRMARLSSHPNAFVRPSPAKGTLGGVTRASYDAMVICEAAGYDKVLVETVGVGQSEVAVADLVDCMVLVMPPVGGDDLQMIKRGIMEVADVILVNKADGPTEAAATRAAAEYAGCLHLMPHRYQSWEPQVLLVSAHTGKGVPALARMVAEFQQALTETGELEQCRTRRAEAITWLNLEEQLLEGLRHDRHVEWLMARLMPWVRAGQMAPRSAADITLAYFYQHCS